MGPSFVDCMFRIPGWLWSAILKLCLCLISKSSRDCAKCNGVLLIGLRALKSCVPSASECGRDDTLAPEYAHQ